MLEGDDVNLVPEMFRPIGNRSFAEAFDLERTPNVVALDCVARQKRIVHQLREDAKEFLPLSFRSS